MNQAFMLLTVAMKESTGSEYPDEAGSTTQVRVRLPLDTKMSIVNRKD